MEQRYSVQSALLASECTTSPGSQCAVLIAVWSRKSRTGERRREAVASTELFFSTAPGDRAELQWRWSLPLSAVLFAALGVPLSHSTPREGRYGRLFTGILIYVLFSNLLSVARNWMDRGVTPIELGLWWVHGLLLLLIVSMMIDANGLRALREWFRRPRMIS